MEDTLMLAAAAFQTTSKPSTASEANPLINLLINVIVQNSTPFCLIVACRLLSHMAFHTEARLCMLKVP
jgi:hypothetical protein